MNMLYLSHLVATFRSIPVLFPDDGILTSNDDVVASPSIAGRYICRANNSFGFTEVSIIIDVQGEACTLYVLQ